MQQSRGSVGHSKHRKAFGKTNRNPRNNLLTAREMNAEKDREKLIKERKKEKMFDSISNLMRQEIL